MTKIKYIFQDIKNQLNKILKIFVLLIGLTLLSLYLFFRIQLINLSPYLAVFSILLFLAEFHSIFHLYGFFYSLWPRKYKTYDNIYRNRKLQINMFICVCGEPAEIVKNTILAAKRAAEHYNKLLKPSKQARVIVLNDGLAAKKDNWEEIEKLSKELGVFHIMRETSSGFKAGNINNGLNSFPSNDPFNTIDIVFDSDFAAKEEFLTEITKPFVDKTVDFVQSPQRYQNEKTWVAKSSAAHQIFFFDHICPSKGHDNALFLCGTNFAIRRNALNSVNGMDTRFITEDYATSLNLHLTGKKGVFMPKVLALGIAPSTLKAYFSQQQRWSKGSFDVSGAYLKQILFGNLTLKQKFHYLLSASYYLIGLRDFILMLAPLPYLLFGVSLIKANTMSFLLFVYGPLLVYNFVLYAKHFQHPVKSMILDIISFPVFTFAFFSSVLKKNLHFIVTIKKYEKENPFKVYRLQLLIIFLLSFGLFITYKFQADRGVGIFINSFWAMFDVVFLSLGFYLISRENYKLYFIDKIFSPIQLFFQFTFQNPFVNYKKVLLRPLYLFMILLILLPTIGSIPEFKFLAFSKTNTKTLVIKNQQELLVPDDGVYYGYYMPDLNKHPKDPKVGIVEGETPSLTMFYQDWGTDKKFDVEFMDKLSKKNVIPVITWEPWDSHKGNVSVKQEKFTPKLIAEGMHDDYVRQWASGAAQFKKPIFLRFAQEMNGNWYGWGNVSGNKPEDYKKMWIHVHKIFEEQHAKNVIWVWSPNNSDEKGKSDSILKYYPGDKYVDWVGFSGFNWGYSSAVSRWSTFDDIAGDVYKILLKLNKPIMVTETSSTSIGGSKLFWYQQTLEKDIPSFKNIKAVIFWNDDFKNSDFNLSDTIGMEYTLQSYLVDNDYYIKEPYVRLII